MTRIVQIGDIAVGGDQPLLVVAGPCVIEEPEMVLNLARFLKAETQKLGLNYVFKASYDKANRTGVNSYRGPGLEKGLTFLKEIRQEVGVPVLSDVHSVGEAEIAADFLDVIQIPAFLSRQTDLLQAAGRTGKPVNVKKGQFLAPMDVKHVIGKLTATGNENLMITERGASFGYNNLVVDMRSLPIMRSFGYPVIFDATHSVQLPGGGEGASGGQREFIGTLARAAVAAGVDGVFMEVHPDPDRALCDGLNSLHKDQFSDLLRFLKEIDSVVRLVKQGEYR
ncbi:MAG: 3-deoxy-8-phosphooctulonate synthase [Deltaproteobacteria bacterium]|nr:3-deoxy-8-phosphooctulonate synthase [Deltaproteobacteria bacterium]MBW2052173.1 3-deoxy-8-phosphooctulonate synthase [Deltaproteobacteria bacterium]MBW2139681.1 3-deoxy-8-phosphooctulonate synthase [Deltaproteobacteria bacterium]MBW2322293.1 3-deoxy-8-phosphooctulonate synthase [Deltaproteobacteria bacterium]